MTASNEDKGQVFTDDDLKRVKEGKAPIEAGRKFAALLARLEAAEMAVEQAYRRTPDNTEYYDQWLKSKGKL